MAENDIYNSQKRYEKLKVNLSGYLSPPTGHRKYQIKYGDNLQYFRKVCKKLETFDNSYIRRIRLVRNLLIICHYIEKDLAEATRDDIDYMIRKSFDHNRSNESKRPFILDVRYIWRLLFPDTDVHGREDDSVIPYVVRHLRTHMDKSTQKLRGDRLTWDEYQTLLNVFSDDIRMQALISLAVESLGRPQELLGRKMKDIELYDGYAKVIISEHGKEGIGILRCIDSYYYVSQWYNQHPLKGDPEAFFFINTGRRGKYKQYKPDAANKLIRERCEIAGIKKRITLYSLKRNGVTFCRMRGDSDVDIQHRARWSSTKQLKTYDLSHHEDSFRKELISRGIIDANKKQDIVTGRTKQCVFCHAENGLSESLCCQCNRPLDREHIEQAIEKESSMTLTLQSQLEEMRSCMQQMMAREEKRVGHDALLNEIVAMPEFKALWAKAKEKERAMKVLVSQ